MDTLAAKIGQLRARETQTAFGARLGVTRQTVMRWEKGLTVPNATQLTAMGITIKYELDSPTRPGTEALPVACDPAIEGGYEST